MGGLVVGGGMCVKGGAVLIYLFLLVRPLWRSRQKPAAESLGCSLDSPRPHFKLCVPPACLQTRSRMGRTRSEPALRPLPPPSLHPRIPPPTPVGAFILLHLSRPDAFCSACRTPASLLMLLPAPMRRGRLPPVAAYPPTAQ